MDIQVGEYIRTTDGVIAKVTNKDEDNHLIIDKYYGGAKYLTNIDLKENIIKHSFNIIDLIEEGDYVNGMRVSYVRFPNDPYEPTEIYVLDKHINFIFASDIKSVITHEQMEAMEYEVK